MQRVKRSTAVAVLPAAPAGGTPGYFAAPNPQGGVPATVPGYEWYNAVQEELVSIALAAGLALDPNDNGQTLESLKRIFGGHMTTINGVIGGTTVALTIANAGLIVIDATNGNVTITLPTANALAAVALRFVRIDGTANIVTILRAGTDMIDNGLTSILLGWQGATQSLAADGVAKWLSMVPTVTAPQFDNSTHLATTAYVKTAGIKTSAQKVINASTILTVADCGKNLSFSTNSVIATLPPANSVPSGEGFVGRVAYGINGCSFAASGTDSIVAGSGVGTSYALSPGDTFMLISDGGLAWIMTVESTALFLKNTPAFLASLSGTGYQKLPSGVIIQWGSCMLGYGGTLASSTGTQVQTTLPIAFPNTFAAGSVFHDGGIPQAYAFQPIGLNAFNTSTTYTSSIGGRFIVIGY